MEIWDTHLSEQAIVRLVITALMDGRSREQGQKIVKQTIEA